MISSDPSEGMTPNSPGEERESGPAGSPVETRETTQTRAAANRPLPSFWEPDAYDEVILEWWGEAYLVECGTLHGFVDEHHDHGDILALVVVEQEDWVEECRKMMA